VGGQRGRRPGPVTPIVGDDLLLGTRVEAWADQQAVDMVLMQRALRLFPRAQVPGFMLAWCHAIGHDPVAQGGDHGAKRG